jgi:hypothetical protein
MSRLVGRSLLLLVLAGAARSPLAADLQPRDGERAFPGGSTVALRGLAPTAATTTNLALVNRVAATNRCSIALTDGNGDRLAPRVSFTLGALEERPYLDVLGDLAPLADGAEAQASISCPWPFSAFAVLADTTGETVQTVAAELVVEPLSMSAPANTKVAACTAGASCFDAEGLVHEPATAKPVGRIVFPAPAGVASRFVTSLDVTVGPWYPQEESGKHLIYWFVVDRNFDMPGLLYFRGPGKYEAFARHGVGLTHPQKIKVIKKWKAEVGHTYHVVNDYDMAAKRYTVTITDVADGKSITLSSRPNVLAYTVKAGAKFIVDMGFPPGKVPTEVPSYGWRYSNLRVEMYR